MQAPARTYNYNETRAMWNTIGEFLKLSSDDNVYVYGKYSYLNEIPETTKLHILRRNNTILFETFWNYFEEVVSVHCYQLINAQGRAVQNPLRIVTESDNTDPFGPRKALYMSITVRNYNGPEVPEDFENEEYTKEYYFMRNAYGVLVGDTGFGSPQNMSLIVSTRTNDMSNEEMTQLVQSAYADDFSEDDSESDEDDIYSNRSNRANNSRISLA